MPPRHPSIAHALGLLRKRLAPLAAATSRRRAHEDALEGAVGPAAEQGVAVHVACSGGPDSVALLGLLHLLAPRQGLALSVGHVDHGLREASASEAAQVQRIAAQLELPCRVTRVELSRGPGLPARARRARRAALREQAAAVGAGVIALGHTATDQAETVLLHLARGAGLEGLAAMATLEPFDPSEPVAGASGWLRPLLDLDRDQARALAQHLRLPFVEDPTNDDEAHPRVAVRKRVLPVLRELNPRVEQALARTATHARQAEDALAQWVERELAARRAPSRQPAASRPDAIVVSGADRHAAQAHADLPAEIEHAVTSGARWSTEGLHRLPVAVRTRFVRRLCRAAGSPDDALAARTLASIDHALLHPGPPRRWDLHPRLRLVLADGELWIESAVVRDSRDQPLTP